MPRSVKETPGPGPRGKKRSSSTVSSGDEAKKARGRPRVEPHDQTAADRRRTQIRLAQRSYRQRKEGTITDLQAKVSHLEYIVSEMNNSFQDINRNAATSNLSQANIHIAGQIADAADRYGELSRNLKRQKTGSGGSSDDSLSEPPEQSSSPSKSTEPTTLITKNGSPNNSTKKALPTIVSTVERGVPSVWGYETIYDNLTPEESNPSTANGVSAADLSLIPTIPSYISSQHVNPNTAWEAVGPLTPYDTSFLDFSFGAGSELPVPMSYAALETTFARRLHRVIIEGGVKLLTEKNPPARRIQGAFGYVMKYYSQIELRDHFLEVLNRAPNEPLESKAVYPYAGPYTEQIWYTEPGDRKAREEMLKAADNVGDGAWFVPQDVQSFLEEKSIHIPRGAMYINWEYETVVPAHPQYPPWASPAASSHGDSVNAPPDQLNGHAPLQQSNSAPLAASNGGMLGVSADWIQNGVPSPPDMDNGAIPLPTNGPIPQAKLQARPQIQRIRRKFTLDVEQLISELKYATVCLGKTPGFRRHEVEAAFANCLVPVTG